MSFFKFQYNIMRNMYRTVFQGGFLHYQPHIFHTPTVFRAGRNDVNAGRVNTAVT